MWDPRGQTLRVGVSGRSDSMGKIVPTPESQTKKLRLAVAIGNTLIK